MSDDPFINAVRAIHDGPHKGFSWREWDDDWMCDAGCRHTNHQVHLPKCPIQLAFDALKRHDAAFTLAHDLYDKYGQASGGPLHIILDDGNCNAHSVKFCAEYLDANKGDYHPDVEVCARALLLLMREMTDSEIQRIYDRYSEYAR